MLGGKFFVSLAALAALSGMAAADSLRVRAGYSVTGTIVDSLGRDRRLQGVELGVDLPLGPVLPGLELYASPSILFGGRLTSGGDLDGEVFRFLVTARRGFGPGGTYGVAGAGVGHTKARGGQFADSNGFVVMLGVGTELRNFVPGIPMQAELMLHQGDHGALRGYTVGLAARF